MISVYPDFDKDFLFRVSRGEIPGAKTFVIAGRKDGISSSVLDDLSQIPGTTVLPVAGGIQLEAISSNPGDASAGVGIQTLEIHYLDTSGLEQSETVTMNGTTAVTTVSTDINDVQWIHAKTVGSSGISVGNISLQSVGGGTVFEYILAGGNQSLSGRYVVPTGITGYVFGWRSSSIVKQVDFRLRATVERFDRALIPGVFLFQDPAVTIDATTGFVPLPWLKMPAGATIKISGISQAAGGNGGGSFQILLVDD